MTLKRLVLIFVLTPIAVLLAVSSLFSSWQEPQFQSRLELYQTNIALQAQAWQAEDRSDDNLQAIREAILGDQPLESSTKQYEEARQSVQANLDKVNSKLAQLSSQPEITPTLPKPLPDAPSTTKTSKQGQKQLQQSPSNNSRNYWLN
jgi:phage shock protein A